MTKKEKTMYKQAAKKAMRENGLKVFQKDMILLETGCHHENPYGIEFLIVDYVMFEDARTGKQYQCFYGDAYYNPETHSFWAVVEYVR